jgi:hypothetical protein
MPTRIKPATNKPKANLGAHQFGIEEIAPKAKCRSCSRAVRKNKKRYARTFDKEMGQAFQPDPFVNVANPMMYDGQM